MRSMITLWYHLSYFTILTISHILYPPAAHLALANLVSSCATSPCTTYDISELDHLASTCSTSCMAWKHILISMKLCLKKYISYLKSQNGNNGIFYEKYRFGLANIFSRFPLLTPPPLRERTKPLEKSPFFDQKPTLREWTKFFYRKNFNGKKFWYISDN
ncbi:unnamed protein product [Blepharisma stoltei]|uniref:Uncharacterized protein n=1 Tax=Blepharisma stoltei TaxID=1481888 RepID=A0AAU9JK65_9CILI|nr:unnamed protein product [Blepharisma stoltei]